MADPHTFTDWIDRSSWGNWSRHPLAGDASARRYCRLVAADGSTVIAVEDPAGPEALFRFAEVAKALRAGGLCAPETLHEDTPAGRAILTDMGPKNVADTLLTTPELEPALYATITDVLCKMHQIALPAWLSPLTPDRAAAAIGPLGEHYAPDIDLTSVQAALTDALARLAEPLVFTHRDFHAENLIWRNEKSGTDRIGLIDFQDAVAAPPAYDIASLTRDARRSVPAATATLVLDRYADKTGTALGELNASVALWAVQRNLRILGLFARLSRAGKPRYLALMPRIWTYLQADLAHPDLGALARTLRNLPAPGGHQP